MNSLKSRFDTGKAHESLASHMEKNFVDSNGKIIVEAYELGISVLEFLSAIHRCMFASKETKDGIARTPVADFFLSLVIENFTIESLNANNTNITKQIDTIKAIDPEAGLEVEKCLYTEYRDILNNHFFRHPGCNILLRPSIIDAVTNVINCYIFTYSKHFNQDIVKANLMSSYSFLSWIAFLCDGSMKNYCDMNIAAQVYGDEVIKVVLDEAKNVS